MKMSTRARCCIMLGLATMIASASATVPRQTTNDEESLKSALDAVTRKQRSLDFQPQNYYKYRNAGDNEVGDEFGREHGRRLEDDEENLEFLPLAENGQLENIGGGYQNFNNRRLERALLDYLESSPTRRETVSSLFRERERTGGHKRAVNNRPSSNNEPHDAALFYKELQNGANDYGNSAMARMDNQDYRLTADADDRYRSQRSKLGRNKFYGSSSGPMSWGEIFDKHEASRNRPAGDIDDNMEEEEEEEQEEGGRNDDLVGERDDSEGMYISPAERRNVNGRYPPLAREYGLVLKRYPLTKRSPKPLQNERQNARIVTDPKVAKDLGALFGGESAGEVKKNRTHDHRDKLQRESKAASMTLGESRLEVSSSVAPGSSVTPGQKEVTNKSIAKRDDGTIEAKKQKKSVDWSQYFGIDRRKKKATFLAKPGSQQQDDNWMLQRYYNTMAENLKSPGSGSEKESISEKREKIDKLDQMDARLKNVKNLIVQDALKYGSEDNSESQEVKDVVMARLAAAYSLEKMRRALNEFRSNIAAQRELMRAAHAKYNASSNYRDNSHESKNENDDKKRRSASNSRVVSHNEESPAHPYQGRDFEGFDEGRLGCPELETIEKSCRPVKSLIGELYEPCVMNQICRACDDEEECSNVFAAEAAKICESIPDSRESRGHCARTAVVIWQMRASPVVSTLCGDTNADSCLRRQYRYRHRALYYQNAWLPSDIALDGGQLRER